MDKLNKSKIYLWSLIIFAIFVVIVNYLELDSSTSMNIALTILIPGIAILLGIDALALFGLKTTQSKGIMCIIGTLLAWLIADLMWLFYENAATSFADIFYMLGYVLLFAGAIFGIMTVKDDFFKSKKWMTIFIVSLILVFGLYYIFPIGWDAEITFLENMVVGGYVFLDFLILVPVIFIIIFSFEGAFSTPWIVLAIGMILNSGADFLYTVPEETLASYGISTIPTIGWNLAYLSFGLGFLLLKMKTEEILAAK